MRLDGAPLKLALEMARPSSERSIAAVIADVGENAALAFVEELERLGRAGLFRTQQLDLADSHERAIRAYMAHHPRKMMLLVSQSCNLRCVYCYAIDGNFPDEGKLMSLGTAQDAIRFLAKRSGNRTNLTVTLFGGEPLVNFRIIRELVPWAREWVASIGKRIHFCITTNGTLLTEAAVEFLIRERFSIMLSLDGPEAIQDRFRPTASGRGSFALAAAGIRRLLARHPGRDGIIVRATMSHQSHDVRQLSEFFEQFGFRRIGLGSTLGFAYGKGPFDLTQQDREEIDDAIESLIDERIADGVRSYTPVPYNPLLRGVLALQRECNRPGPRVKMACGVGRNDQGVDVDGRIYPCHRYVGMNEYVLGDIWSGIDDDAARRYYDRLAGVYERCRRCWATRWCAGACPRYVSAPDGTVMEPDESHCRGVRRSLERTLAWHAQFEEEGLDWDRLEREASTS